MRRNVTERGIALARAGLIIAVFAALLAAGVSTLGGEHRFAAVGRRTLASGARQSPTGEVPFAAPMPLRTLGRSSVREGPGDGYPVLFTFEAGTPVDAHSYTIGHGYAENWVLVSDERGRSGWMSSALLGGQRGPGGRQKGER